MSRPKVILTRSKEDIERDKRFFEREGLSVVALPLIRTVPVEFCLQTAETDYVVFQSAKAVKYFLNRASIPEGAKVVAVGEKTASALEREGYRADILPSDSSAKGLVELFKGLSKGKVLIPRSAVGRTELIEFLKGEGFDVLPISVYTTEGVVYPKVEFISRLSEGDFIVFASPSAVNGFFANLQKAKGENLLDRLIVCSIGKTTKSSLEAKGVKVSLVPPKPSMEAVATTLKRFWLENC